MATADPSFGAGPEARAGQPSAAAPSRARARDPRLDFFRGVAMFIILIAHTPGNWWTRWIPARFGFSDATEIFVFCSGMASAIAFGATFARAGWWMGTARTVFRIWQVYWAHVGLFFFIAMTMAALDLTGRFEGSYVELLNLTRFFDDPMPQLVGLFTLTYVPNYFDILPMYLVILAMMPFYVALARVSVPALMLVSVGIWLACNAGAFPLPAEPWSDRTWFFNPFGWQLLFFTGFAFMAGWLPKPPIRRDLVWAAVAFLVLTLPLSSPHAVTLLKATWPPGAELAMTGFDRIEILRHKSEFGVLRYIHFLCLAYLAWIVVGPAGELLQPEGAGAGARLWRGLVTVTIKVGQQSLAIFVFSMAYARLLGVALDQMGRTAVTMTLTNLVGLATLVAVAYGVAWVKTHPWRAKRA